MASLDEVHCSHAAQVMRVSEELAAWGVQADFAAVSAHPAATWSFSFLARTIVVVNTVVVLAQHRQVRRLGMPTVFVCVDVVNLASIGRYGAVWPWAHQVFRHGQGAQLL